MENVKFFQSQYDGIQLIDAHYHEFAFHRHYHLDLHIGLITKGSQDFIFKGSQHHAGEGQFVIMPPDELHDGQAKLNDGYETKVFSIDPHWFNDHLDLPSIQTIPDFQQLIIDDSELFTRLNFLHGQMINSQCSQLAQDCLPLDCFEMIIDRYADCKIKPTVSLGSQSIESLREYIMANLDQPIRLNELASLCQLSPSQFQRQFKSKMTMPPYAWLSRLRMEEALSLLLQGKSSTDVAMLVGFYDQAHFVRAFKTCYGITPSQV